MAREVKATIDATLLKIAELNAIIQDYQGEPGLLPSKLEEYSLCLKQLVAQKDGLLAQDGTPIEVAVEMLRRIDEGDNPDAFTSAVFRSSLAANQACKGKVEAVRDLRTAVHARFKTAFPEEMQRYDRLRQRTADPNVA
uniref:Mediator of RNA polymerase II transcription subunit 10 n=1 Tax=Auxenochlorella protothecoides TaxID=3075 RepID=A0A1D2A479_AUXPR